MVPLEVIIQYSIETCKFALQAVSEHFFSMTVM